jgi:hypothetical protein
LLIRRHHCRFEPYFRLPTCRRIFAERAVIDISNMMSHAFHRSRQFTFSSFRRWPGVYFAPRLFFIIFAAEERCSHFDIDTPVITEFSLIRHC